MDTFNFNKTPATLQTLSAFSTSRNNNLWFLPIDCCRYVTRMNGYDLSIVDNVFACDKFEFVLIQSSAIFPRGKIDCEPIQNTLDALLLSEFEPVYFKLLEKILNNTFYAKIPISIHFYKKLFEDGIILRMLKCNTMTDIHKLLLLLSGDVETNPGPETYKELCKHSFNRKKVSRFVEKSKERSRVERELRRIEDNSFSYIKEVKRVNNKDVEFQIFSAVSSIVGMGASAYTGIKANKTMDEVSKLASTLTSEITTTLTQFRDTFTDIKRFIYKGLNVIDLIGDIVMALLQVSFARSSCKISSLGIELFRILVKYGISTGILDQLKTLIHPYMSGEIKEVEFQIDCEPILQQLNPNHIVIFLISILSTIFLTVVPKASQLEQTLKRVGDVARSAKNITDFSNVTHTMIGATLDDFKVNYLGLRPAQEIENFISGIDRWFDEVRSMLLRSEEWKKSDQILCDPAVVIEVENLYKRGMEFSREITDKKLAKDLTLPFQVHMRYLTDLMKLVDTSGAFGTKPRTQPVVIWLYGESGVGKSGMSWPLAVDLNNLFVHNADEAKEFSKNIYMRNVEQEFWDNYQGQNVVIYDDFGQRVDSTTNPNEEFMELIRTANIAPYPLHMAHLEDKRKTRFTSKILLLTSNVFEQNISSLTFPDAFRRRIDLCAKVTNKAEFVKTGYSARTATSVSRLDKEKVQRETGEIISTDVYELEIVDPESGVSIEVGLSYEEFLERAVEKATAAFDSSRKMNEFLEKYAMRRFLDLDIAHSRSEKRIIHDEIIEAPVEFQISRLESAEWNYDFLDDKEWSEIERMLDDGMLVYNNDLYNAVDKDNLLATIYLDYIEKDDMSISFEQFKLDEVRKLCIYRESKLYKGLTRAKNQAMNMLMSWRDAAINACKEHPYIVASTVMMTLSTLLYASGFWRKFFKNSQKRSVVLEEKQIKRNVIVKPYNGEEGIDLTQKDDEEIFSFLPTLLQHSIVDAGISLILRRPSPLLVGFLSGLQYTCTLYIKDKIFNHHGKRIVLEAKPSGDDTTLAKSKVMLEANSSSDALTLSKPRVMLEANPSGDVTTLHNKIAHLESFGYDLEEVDASMQMWKDQVAQNLISNRIFTNLYKISRVRENGDIQPLLNGIFVRSNIMLVPAHLLGFLNIKDTIEITNTFNSKYILPWREIKMEPMYDALGNKKESCLLLFPKYVPAHSELVKHFSNGDSMNRYKKADVCLPVLRYSSKFDKLLMMILGNTQASALDHPVHLNDSALSYSHVMREGLIYQCPTIGGDCGAPVIVNETQVLRKIAGIHVAGSREGNYAESVTEKDLLRALAKIPVEFQIRLDLDRVLISPNNIDLPFNEEFDIDKLTFCNLPSDNLLPQGKIGDVIFEPGNTELRPSLIHGKLDPIQTKPAYLKHKDINIKHRNLAKNALNTPFISTDLIDRAYELVKGKWLSNRRPELARVLTFEEVVKGCDLSEYTGPLNRQSSPGYPWILKKKAGWPGKTGWFGNDQDYIVNKEVQTACEERIRLAKLGIRTPTLWVDTLKDERRPIVKVEQFKTRVFNNGPMDFNLCFRQYFLAFIAHLMENRILNEVSIGTNVYSTDWGRTARKLKTKGDKVIAGDFSTFDGTLNSCLMSRFVKLANEFYADGEENALIREVLFLEVYNSVHLCDGSVYGLTHSQPSGNPATTPLNCFINSMSVRICFHLCVKDFGLSMRDFDQHVSLVSYGDDNVINFSDFVADKFNMDTITQAFDVLGMIYTDETKSERGTAPKWKKLEEVAYLKRGFYFNEERKIWDAPLSMDTIMEMPNWCRGSLDIEEGTRVNCENAIMELAMHPREIFDKQKQRISQAFYQVTNNVLTTDTYNGYFEKRFMDYFI